MVSLIVEASNGVCSIACLENKTILSEKNFVCSNNLSAVILEEIDNCLKEANKKIIDMYMAMKDIKKFTQTVNEEKKKNNKEDKQKSLKNYINSYNKTAKSQEAKKEILQYFCDALNKVIPKNKRYKIKEIEEIFEKIENLYNLSNFLYDKNLKFILGFPLFYSYISKKK